MSLTSRAPGPASRAATVLEPPRSYGRQRRRSTPASAAKRTATPCRRRVPLFVPASQRSLEGALRVVQRPIDVLRVDRAASVEVLEQVADPLPLEEQSLLRTALGLPREDFEPCFGLLDSRVARCRTREGEW